MRPSRLTSAGIPREMLVPEESGIQSRRIIVVGPVARPAIVPHQIERGTIAQVRANVKAKASSHGLAQVKAHDFKWPNSLPEQPSGSARIAKRFSQEPIPCCALSGLRRFFRLRSGTVQERMGRSGFPARLQAAQADRQRRDPFIRCTSFGSPGRCPRLLCCNPFGAGK